jgi:hypothetical protein
MCDTRTVRGLLEYLDNMEIKSILEEPELTFKIVKNEEEFKEFLKDYDLEAYGNINSDIMMLMGERKNHIKFINVIPKPFFKIYKKNVFYKKYKEYEETGNIQNTIHKISN